MPALVAIQGVVHEAVEDCKKGRMRPAGLCVHPLVPGSVWLYVVAVPLLPARMSLAAARMNLAALRAVAVSAAVSSHLRVTGLWCYCGLTSWQGGCVYVVERREGIWVARM
jgi:hypothetical protein